MVNLVIEWLIFNGKPNLNFTFFLKKVITLWCLHTNIFKASLFKKSDFCY